MINDSDKLLERSKLFGEFKKNTSIIREENSLTEAFNSLYNNTVRIEIRQNISILNYYEAFEKSSDQKNREIYETILKVHLKVIDDNGLNVSIKDNFQ